MNFDHEVKTAKDLLYYVNNKLKTDQEFFKLESEKRYKQVSDMEEYKQFILAFPIVSRYIVQLGLFSSKVFKKYLTHLNTIKPTAEERALCINNNEEQMLWFNKQRALYVKWIHMEKTRNHDVNEANKVYNETVQLLNEDTKKMFKILNKEKEKIKQQDDKHSDELRQYLIQSLYEKNNIQSIVEQINEL
jgi:hypothetical protein